MANLTDVMSAVRSQHKIRQRMEEPGGATYTIDRRTIDRALQRLQHVLNQVTVVESVNPLSPMGEQTSLVILNPTGDADAEQMDFAALVAEYWQRDALKALQAAAMDVDSKDSSAPRNKSVRAKRAKVGRPKSAVVAGKRKRKVVILGDSDTDDSDSSYSDGAGGSGSESGSGSSGSEEEHPQPKRALWKSDSSPVRAARRTAAGVHSGSVGGSASVSASTAASAAELIPKELRKSYRNRAIKQKKTFEDPLVFEEVAHPATEPAGWLVAAMRLHLHLVRALLSGPQAITSSCSEVAGSAGEKATFALADLLKDLPLGFLLSSNAHLRRQIASRMVLESSRAYLA